MHCNRRERGQAALVAVVGLLILAIGMYTSYNLSRAVYEKIELQNAADATAYSLATLEARTFNFISFVNRAQVANYVQMMEAQSLLSNMTAIEGSAGWGGDVLLSAAKLVKAMAAIPIFRWMQAIATVLETAGRALEKVSDTATLLVNQMETFVPNYIKLQNTKNWALLAVAGMYVMTTSLQLGDGGSTIVAANDPDARLTVVSYLLNAINIGSFVTAIDWQGLFGSVEDNGSNEAIAARRLMTEITNASRYSSVFNGKPDYIVSRDLFDVFLGAVTTLTGISTDGRGGSRASSIINKIVNAFSGQHYGTAKILEPGDSTDLAKALPLTAQHDPGKSDLALGTALLAKDLAGFTRFYKLDDWGFFSVISTADKSLHCRYVKPTSGYGSSGARFFPLVINPRSRQYGFDRNNCKDQNEDNHTWGSFIGKSGMAPYFPFASKESGFEAEKSSFNQPDVWVMLNKEPESMALSGAKDLNFEIKQGRVSAALDARIGEEGLFQSGAMRGVNVMARAQVYYHRPGAWQEPPNFFNPFWGARLAPKNVAIKRLASALGLGGTFSQIIADNIWMH